MSPPATVNQLSSLKAPVPQFRGGEMAMADQFDGGELVPAVADLACRVEAMERHGDEPVGDVSGQRRAVFDIIVFAVCWRGGTTAYRPLSKMAATCSSTVTGSFSSCEMDRASEAALSLFLLPVAVPGSVAP